MKQACKQRKCMNKTYSTFKVAKRQPPPPPRFVPPSATISTASAHMASSEDDSLAMADVILTTLGDEEFMRAEDDETALVCYETALICHGASGDAPAAAHATSLIAQDGPTQDSSPRDADSQGAIHLLDAVPRAARGEARPCAGWGFERLPRRFLL